MSDCQHCDWVNGWKALRIQDGSASMAYDTHMRAEHYPEAASWADVLSFDLDDDELPQRFTGGAE